MEPKNKEDDRKIGKNHIIFCPKYFRFWFSLGWQLNREVGIFCFIFVNTFPKTSIFFEKLLNYIYLKNHFDKTFPKKNYFILTGVLSLEKRCHTSDNGCEMHRKLSRSLLLESFPLRCVGKTGDPVTQPEQMHSTGDPTENTTDIYWIWIIKCTIEPTTQNMFNYGWSFPLWFPHCSALPGATEYCPWPLAVNHREI